MRPTLLYTFNNYQLLFVFYVYIFVLSIMLYKYSCIAQNILRLAFLSSTISWICMSFCFVLFSNVSSFFTDFKISIQGSMFPYTIFIILLDDVLSFSLPHLSQALHMVFHICITSSIFILRGSTAFFPTRKASYPILDSFQYVKESDFSH